MNRMNATADLDSAIRVTGAKRAASVDKRYLSPSADVIHLASGDLITESPAASGANRQPAVSDISWGIFS